MELNYNSCLLDWPSWLLEFSLNFNHICHGKLFYSMVYRIWIFFDFSSPNCSLNNLKQFCNWPTIVCLATQIEYGNDDFDDIMWSLPSRAQKIFLPISPICLNIQLVENDNDMFLIFILWSLAKSANQKVTWKTHVFPFKFIKNENKCFESSQKKWLFWELRKWDMV